jgi:KaiC/GvpD/RAD55 family RecA-like ATPase
MLQSVAISPGVGKTMLSIGLGWAAVDAGHKVHYTTASDLAARCHKAALEGRWANMMRFYSSPRLLIIDLCRQRDYPDSRREDQAVGGERLGVVGIVTGFRVICS